MRSADHEAEFAARRLGPARPVERGIRTSRAADLRLEDDPELLERTAPSLGDERDRIGRARSVFSMKFACFGEICAPP